MDEGDTVSVRRASELTGWADKTLRRWIASGKLPAEKLAVNQYRVRLADIPPKGAGAASEQMGGLRAEIAALKHRLESVESSLALQNALRGSRVAVERFDAQSPTQAPPRQAVRQRDEAPLALPRSPAIVTPARAPSVTMPLGGHRGLRARPSRAKPPVPEGDAPPEVVEEVHRIIAAGIMQMPPALWAKIPRLWGGWVAFRTWCNQHNLNVRAVEQEVYERGKMPAPSRGAWRPGSGGVPITGAYSPEQQEAAADYARTRWPDRWRP